MPGVLSILAERLRKGDLDPEEIAFLSNALEQIARAVNPAKEASAALLLRRPRGRSTNADKFDLALPRAQRAYELINRQGMKYDEAFEKVAEEEGVDDSQIGKAYYLLKDGIEEEELFQEQFRGDEA